MPKNTKSEQGKSLFAQRDDWLPLLDEFRNWFITEEAKKLCEELVMVA